MCLSPLICELDPTSRADEARGAEVSRVSIADSGWTQARCLPRAWPAAGGWPASLAFTLRKQAQAAFARPPSLPSQQAGSADISLIFSNSLPLLPALLMVDPVNSRKISVLFPPLSLALHFFVLFLAHPPKKNKKQKTKHDCAGTQATGKKGTIYFSKNETR